MFDRTMNFFRETIKDFPDNRHYSPNLTYRMEDFALSAFSIFFLQNPSFLAHQKAMEKAKGKNNARALFGISKIPCDNQIRGVLDEVEPQKLDPMFDKILEEFSQTPSFKTFRGVEGNILAALDGTWYFSSQEVHCVNCSTMEHKKGQITYYHSAITPVIVAPGQKYAISLKPEFIVPQDGHEKQDCETTAAKRWINKHAQQYAQMGTITFLGDDIYSKQPMCQEILDKQQHFIFVCKEDSHKTLYEWIKLLEKEKDLAIFTEKKWNGKFWEIYTYKYTNGAPLRDTDDALMVNWLDITITKKSGEALYHNAFITDHQITQENVASVAVSGRCRWKIENENNNTLKTKGYHLEHNFGHGQKYLSSLFATMNILAFLSHTLLDWVDEKYRLLRKSLPARKTFFEHLRALTCYVCFESWDQMLDFMLEGLEIEHNFNTC